MNIEAHDVEVRFGEHIALRGATLWPIAPGEIHALIGDNGSGKSTFLRLVAGQLGSDAQVTGGRLLADGQDVLPFYDRAVARALGVFLVPQRPEAVPILSAQENIFLGRERLRGGLFRNVKAEEAVLHEAVDALGWEHPASKGPWSAADRQKMAVLRVLCTDGAKILLMDEPTTFLSDGDATSLREGLLRLAKEKGVGVVLVSHKAADVRCADRVTLFQDGLTTRIFEQGGVQEAEASLERGTVAAATLVTRTVMALKGGLAAEAAGQIVGVWVADPDAAKRVFHSCVESLAAFNPTILLPDRGESGALFGLSVHENIQVDPTLGGGLVWGKRSIGDTVRRLEATGVPADWLDRTFEHLSGGFQQRVLLARTLLNASVVVGHNPTQGLDAKSRGVLNATLQERAQNSDRRTVLVGSDIGELRDLSTVLWEVSDA